MHSKSLRWNLFPISTDILFKLLIKMREEEHVEVLNQFSKGEALESLSREDLRDKIGKKSEH